VAPGGFSTLERHEHMHAVLILRGRGHCLVGGEVRPGRYPRSHHRAAHDLAPVPRHAGGRSPSLHGERRARRPQLPSAEDLAKLKADAKIAAFLRDGLN
jgi:hypothetical protein